MKQLIGLNIVLTAIFVSANEQKQYTMEQLTNKCIRIASQGSCLDSLNGKAICMVELIGSRRVLQKCENINSIRTTTIVCCPEGVYYHPTVSTIRQRTTETVKTTVESETEILTTRSVKVTKKSVKEITSSESDIKTTKVRFSTDSPKSTTQKESKTTFRPTTMMKQFQKASKTIYLEPTSKYHTLDKKSTDTRPTTPLTTSGPKKTLPATSSKQELKLKTTVATKSCNLKKAIKKFKSKIPLKQNKCPEFKSYQQEVSDLWRIHDANLDIIKVQMREERKRIDALIARNKITKVGLKKLRSK